MPVGIRCGLGPAVAEFGLGNPGAAPARPGRSVSTTDSRVPPSAPWIRPGISCERAKVGLSLVVADKVLEPFEQFLAQGVFAVDGVAAEDDRLSGRGPT